jgi:hypothetical protein
MRFRGTMGSVIPDRRNVFGGDMSRRRSDAGERFYVGRRSARTEVYLVTRRDAEPLRHPVGDDFSFEWGRDAGPGGIELARAILRDATRCDPPDQVCAQFHAEVIASLPHAGFVLSCDDVALCLALGLHEPATWRFSPVSGGRRRITAWRTALSCVWLPMTIRWTYLRGGGGLGGS